MVRSPRVAGLRAIDASATPAIPSGNTNTPSIMIGEKGADLDNPYPVSMWCRGAPYGTAPNHKNQTLIPKVGHWLSQAIVMLK